MRALGKQSYQHHQVRKREQPLVRGHAGGFRGARYKAQMAALCEIVQMIHANARQRRYF